MKPSRQIQLGPAFSRSDIDNEWNSDLKTNLCFNPFIWIKRFILIVFIHSFIHSFIQSFTRDRLNHFGRLFVGQSLVFATFDVLLSQVSEWINNLFVLFSAEQCRLYNLFGWDFWGKNVTLFDIFVGDTYRGNFFVVPACHKPVLDGLDQCN